MSFVRPELTARIWQAREAVAAALVIAAGLWLVWLGGYVLWPLGAAIAVLGLTWGGIALRRLRFARSVEAPGVVEVDEGQIGYLGPTFGGYLSLRELAEIRLIDVQGRRHWRLKQADGQVLMIPISAAGAELLHDAFAALPGIDMGALSRALGGSSGTRILWKRPDYAALT